MGCAGSIRKLFAIWLVSLAVAACRPSVALTPVQPRAESAEARISLIEIDNDILKFVVYNLSSEPIVVLRDEIRLVGAHGTWARETGGIERVYNLAAGQAHEVNVRFDFSGLDPGEVAKVSFEHALMIAGRPVQVPPILIRHE